MDTRHSIFHEMSLQRAKHKTQVEEDPLKHFLYVYLSIYIYWASSDVVNCLAILAKTPNFCIAKFVHQDNNKYSCILHAIQ